VQKRTITAVKRVDFVSNKMSYRILRSRWCYIVVLNVHAPTEDNIGNVKDNFYKELERAFHKFSKYHTMAADCDTDHYLVVAKVRERLAVDKQLERSNLEKSNEVEGIEQ
jgi:hypothetical protein